MTVIIRASTTMSNSNVFRDIESVAKHNLLISLGIDDECINSTNNEGEWVEFDESRVNSMLSSRGMYIFGRNLGGRYNGKRANRYYIRSTGDRLMQRFQPQIFRSNLSRFGVEDVLYSLGYKLNEQVFIDMYGDEIQIAVVLS